MSDVDLIEQSSPREAHLVRTLVSLADNLVANFDVVELLTIVADSCVDVLGAGAAGIMLVAPDGGLRVLASSNEAMRVLELFEVQASEGPCFDCFSDGMPIGWQVLSSADARWPNFAPVARAAGFQSVQALPMRLRGTVIGALNLFHLDLRPMPAIDVDAAQAFADIATIAILQHRASSEAQMVNEQLEHALNSRIVIEQAKGMIAERKGIGMEAAFASLRHHARSQNLRLADVAGDIISGTLAVSALTAPRTR